MLDLPVDPVHVGRFVDCRSSIGQLPPMDVQADLIHPPAADFSDDFWKESRRVPFRFLARFKKPSKGNIKPVEDLLQQGCSSEDAAIGSLALRTLPFPMV